MAGFKLMSMKEHFDRVNNSTFFGNLNTGQFVDNSRFRMDQKIKEFGKIQNSVYNDSNFIADQTFSQSNYGRIK
jgi:CRISPR/Cas system-associated endoribonuclease Cas2|tara:strand:+ start:58 stop:279 length:222 start_codon:yes stop_codon:yes gene_type:complete